MKNIVWILCKRPKCVGFGCL